MQDTQQLAKPRPVPGPPHLRPVAIGLVMVGGALGAAAREAAGLTWPATSRGVPTSTLVINLAGSFLLGLLLEMVVRAGDDSGWRRRARLLGGTGFCGGFTTYSTFAVETVQLGRHDAWAAAAIYLAISVGGGLLAAAAGILVGSTHARGRTPWLPLDPDAGELGGRP